MQPESSQVIQQYLYTSSALQSLAQPAADVFWGSCGLGVCRNAHNHLSMPDFKAFEFLNIPSSKHGHCFCRRCQKRLLSRCAPELVSKSAILGRTRLKLAAAERQSRCLPHPPPSCIHNSKQTCAVIGRPQCHGKF